MFCIVPVRSKTDDKGINTFSLAKYGGKGSDYLDLMFSNSQSSGHFGYDVSNIDMNTLIKNLKYNTVEVTERVYVDKLITK